MTRLNTADVWSELGGDLRRFIRRRVSDDHLAEDLLQETFVRIHRHLGGLRGRDRLAAWVYQIARNVVRDHYRGGDSEISGLHEFDVVEPPSDSLHEFRCHSTKWLEQLIRQLPETYQEAVRLSELEGLTQQEVAQRLAMSLSGAKSRVQRGRAQLKEVLEQCCSFQFDRRGNLLDVDPKPERTVCRDCDG